MAIFKSLARPDYTFFIGDVRINVVEGYAVVKSERAIAFLRSYTNKFEEVSEKEYKAMTESVEKPQVPSSVAKILLAEHAKTPVTPAATATKK